MMLEKRKIQKGLHGRALVVPPATSPGTKMHVAKLGATDADLADVFEVSISTIETRKAKHPRLCWGPASLGYGQHTKGLRYGST
jgi:hypothetical protein